MCSLKTYQKSTKIQPRGKNGKFTKTFVTCLLLYNASSTLNIGDEKPLFVTQLDIFKSN